MIEHSLMTKRMIDQYPEHKPGYSENRFHCLVHQLEIGILILDKDNIVDYANPAAASILSTTVHELLESAFPYPVETEKLSRINLNGEEDLYLRTSEIEWEGKASTLVSLYKKDQKTESGQNSEGNKVKTLFKIMQDPFFILDVQKRIIHNNPASAEFLKFNEKELIGTRFYELFPQRKWEEIKSILEDVRENHPILFQIPIQKKNGSQLPVQTRLAKGEWDNKPVYFAACTDISEQKRLELSLQHSQEQLQLTMFSDSEFLWSLETRKDGSMNYQYLSQSVEKVTGFPPEIFLNGSRDWLEIVHPDDRAFVKETNSRRIVEGLRENIEYRIVLPDGKIRWIRDNLKSRKIIENRIRLDGVISDITERKRADEILQQTNEQLRLWVNELKQRNSEVTLLNEMGDLLQSCLSTENIYMVVKQFAHELFPGQSGALYILDSSLNLLEAVISWGDSPPVETVFSPEDCWGLRRNQLQAITDPNIQIRCDHIGVNEKRPYLCVPMTAQTETLGLLHIRGTENASIDHLKQLALMMAGRIAMALSNIRLSETLRKQSIRDPLTGLFNRRYLEEMLGRELRRALRYNRPIGLIYLDIDHFKIFNDTYGHGAGDAVLRELGSFLQSQIRGEDIACRYGGEEFIIMLAEASLSDTFKRAENLCADIRQLRVGYGDKSLGNITVSMGVSGFPELGDEAEVLIESADKALYKAKKAGRNRVVLARTPEKK